MKEVYCGVRECEYFKDGRCRVDQLHISTNNEEPTHTEETNCMSFKSEV